MIRLVANRCAGARTGAATFNFPRSECSSGKWELCSGVAPWLILPSFARQRISESAATRRGGRWCGVSGGMLMLMLMLMLLSESNSGEVHGVAVFIAELNRVAHLIGQLNWVPLLVPQVRSHYSYYQLTQIFFFFFFLFLTLET